MKLISTIGLFLLSAGLSAICLAPRQASAGVRTLDASGCQSSYTSVYGTVSCGLTIDASFPSGTLGGAYFDFSDQANFPGNKDYLTLMKRSYSGTIYADSIGWAVINNNMVDLYVTAVNVKLNASAYDYVHGTVNGGASLFVLGMTLTN